MARPLVQASGLTFAYDGHRVFDAADFVLHEGDKVAVVGPNGAGKSTFFKLLMGELHPELGSIDPARELKIGYMPQIHAIHGDLSGADVLRVPSAEETRLEREIARLEEWMTRPDAWDAPDANDRMTRYGELQERVARERSKASGTTSPLLSDLGVPEESLTSRFDDLSGGEKTKLLLARALANAKELDLIILDEPTNHLDVETVEWVEEHLLSLKGSVLLSSHDRYLLDNIATRVFEVGSQKVLEFDGNYTAYKEQKAAIQRAWDAKKKRDREELKRQLQIIQELKRRNKFDAQVRSREKRMRTGSQTVAERKSPTTEAAPAHVSERARKAMRLDFKTSQKSSNDVLVAENIAKSYGDRTLYRGVSFEVVRGDKVALVGPNGCGKTTLLKILAGAEKPDTGTIQVSPGVKLGFFAQEHETLNPERTVLEEMRLARGETHHTPEAEARSVLGRFLFRGEDVYKTLGVLSGGERARLALSKFILQECNLLVLDEPTNHLDLPSQEVVQAALDEYKGTIIVVSHDRSFLEAVCNKVAYVAGGQVGLFAGRFTDAWTMAKMTEFGRVATKGLFKVGKSFTDWESGKRYLAGETIELTGLETQSFRRLMKWCVETGRVEAVATKTA
ncbi:MAG: ATP-binding cassette domain-containing protein [Euryarchaeota archaeon]|nr:ATP-binding cassette domain-containing protein [Euryarchaeota archaeon]